MQKMAGDIDAIERICDILLANKLTDDDVEMISTNE